MILYDAMLHVCRAMTRKAPVPALSRPPKLLELNVATCSLLFQVDVTPIDSQNSNHTETLIPASKKSKKPAVESPFPITHVNFEVHDVTNGITTSDHRYAVTDEQSNDYHFVLSHFIAGLTYKFRIRAENEVGMGPASDWTMEIKFPQVSKKSSLSTSVAVSSNSSCV